MGHDILCFNLNFRTRSNVQKLLIYEIHRVQLFWDNKIWANRLIKSVINHVNDKVKVLTKMWIMAIVFLFK